MCKLDETDQKILMLLQTNARVSYADVGRQVNLTAPAVAGRIRRLEELGVVAGYHADINATALGNELMVFVRLAVAHHRERQFSQFLCNCKEVVEGYLISGEETYLLKVAVQSIGHLNQLLGQFMYYGQPITSFVLARVPRKTEVSYS